MNILKGILTIIAILVITVVLIGYPVMWLWNILMPELFHLPEINFWQAVGLSALCSLLFKSTVNNKSKD